jgi:hypothetical protein
MIEKTTKIYINTIIIIAEINILSIFLYSKKFFVEILYILSQEIL